MQVQELLLESEKLREDVKLFNSAKESLPYDDPNAMALINTQKLVQRIEELEDLVQDLKNKHSAQESCELKAIISSQSYKISLL